MKRIVRSCFVFCLLSLTAVSQNALFIPDTLSGTTFNLNVQNGVRQFVGTNNTPTYGFNGNFITNSTIFVPLN